MADSWMEFSWPRVIGWGVLAWLALGLAACADARHPGDGAWLVGLAPLAMVFLAGVHERQIWWVRGALLNLVPAVALLIWSILDVTVGDSRQRAGAELAAGILLVAGAILLICGTVALVIAAWLGVLLGQRLTTR